MKIKIDLPDLPPRGSFRGVTIVFVCGTNNAGKTTIVLRDKEGRKTRAGPLCEADYLGLGRKEIVDGRINFYISDDGVAYIGPYERSRETLSLANMGAKMFDAVQDIETVILYVALHHRPCVIIVESCHLISTSLRWLEWASKYGFDCVFACMTTPLSVCKERSRKLTEKAMKGPRRSLIERRLSDRKKAKEKDPLMDVEGHYYQIKRIAARLKGLGANVVMLSKDDAYADFLKILVGLGCGKRIIAS
jgi:hypothetical protein